MARKFAALNEISREFSFALNDISFGQNESSFALNHNSVGRNESSFALDDISCE